MPPSNICSGVSGGGALVSAGGRLCLRWRSIGFQRWTIGLRCRRVGVRGCGIGLRRRSVGVGRWSIGVRRSQSAGGAKTQQCCPTQSPRAFWNARRNVVSVPTRHSGNMRPCRRPCAAGEAPALPKDHLECGSLLPLGNELPMAKRRQAAALHKSAGLCRMGVEISWSLVERGQNRKAWLTREPCTASWQPAVQQVPCWTRRVWSEPPIRSPPAVCC